MVLRGFPTAIGGTGKSRLSFFVCFSKTPGIGERCLREAGASEPGEIRREALRGRASGRGREEASESYAQKRAERATGPWVKDLICPITN